MNKISAIIGIVLLAASIVLAFFSNKAEVTLKNNQALIAKYVSEAQSALDEGDTAKATKLAKMAIKVDPNVKDGYIILDKICQSKYKPTDEESEDTSNSSEEPEVEEAEDDDMGC